MTFSTNIDADAHINKYHTSFAELPTANKQNAFDTMLKVEDFFQSNIVAVGCTVPAVMFDGTKTEIYIERHGENGWRFIERPVHDEATLSDEKPVDISTSSIENVLWNIRDKVYSRNGSTRDTAEIMEPLNWYIKTDRAPLEFIRLLCSASSRQLTTIANRLIKHAGGDYDMTINSVCEYIGISRA